MTSFHGGRDGVLDREHLAEARARPPVLTVYVEVEGATHAYFGDYGPQSGDGKPTIPRQEARAEIIDASNALVRRIDDQEASGINSKPDA